MGARSETTLQLLHEFIRTVKNLGFQAVQKNLGFQAETTLQLLHEFIRTVKKRGFQAVQNGEERTPWTWVIHRVQHHTRLLT